MCGIVGAIAQREVSTILLEGLKRLEYRGYDSAGMALCNALQLQNLKRVGKVAQLEQALQKQPLLGKLGIAHTRWATHGAPSEQNAHPQFSSSHVAVVHNGIIENYQALKNELIKQNYVFTSETDTEVIAHLFAQNLDVNNNLVASLQQTIASLEGAYALAIISSQYPDVLLAARYGSPLIIGLGLGENFVASDILALRQVTDRFIYLEDGDYAFITCDEVKIFAANGQQVRREIVQANTSLENLERGEYRHFMHKEIHEQPQAILNTLDVALKNKELDLTAFGTNAASVFAQIERVQIVACGTSFHAASVGRYWLESLAHLPCQVEVASEFRYRKVVVEPNTLLVTLSQSGETADTLAALRMAKKLKFIASLAICNNAQSTLVRESDLSFLTQAGVEVGVASTKAFTTQLVALFMLTLALGKVKSTITTDEIKLKTELLYKLPAKVYEVLALEKTIEQVAEYFVEKEHSLFLGRGTLYPIALEGALKLKEISYIHAEGYPAGELKHGPLALVDADMPVVVVAPNNRLMAKLQSNLQEVRARGGKLLVFADNALQISKGDDIKIITMPQIESFLAAILYSVPLQLLAYYVAVLKGTDVDQPRNLAKSVTVE